MTFEEEKLFRKNDLSPDAITDLILNQVDFTHFASYYAMGTGNYTIMLCIKQLFTLLVTCEPVVKCNPSVKCSADQAPVVPVVPVVTKQSAKKASKDSGSLLGLLFIPGFFVGLCVAYGVYRQRVKNRVNETGKAAHRIEAPLVNNHVAAPTNQPL